MVPTITEEMKQLSKYDKGFRRLVSNLRRNKAVVFVDKEEEAQAVLVDEKTFERMEEYLETADILLKNPNILDDLKKAHKQAKRAKKLSLDDLKKKFGV